jgi:hypothetical protein
MRYLKFFVQLQCVGCGLGCTLFFVFTQIFGLFLRRYFKVRRDFGQLKTPIFSSKQSKYMRILGSLDQNGLKITVFKNDNRLSVKLENEQYEQTFKFRESVQLDDFEAVKKLIDAAFLSKIQTNFQAMHAARLEAFERAFPISEEVVFDVII